MVAEKIDRCKEERSNMEGKRKMAKRIRRAAAVTALGILAAGSVSCGKQAERAKTETWRAAEEHMETSENALRIEVSSPQPVETSADHLINPEGMTLAERIGTPAGYQRISCQEGSFGQFVRDYKLLPDQSPVLLFNGEEKSVQDDHAAVFDMFLSDRDLQQCADSVMRIYAEYHWNKGEYGKISYQFVNGFPCSYEKWRNGYRVKIDGSRTEWVKKGGADDSRESFEQYLNTVFAYSSTLSMQKESVPAELQDMKIGDVFLYSGSPGHVAMVADVCENEKGEKAFLLAQGYMPAQQFHLLKNPLHENDPWYYMTEFSWPLITPEYTFSEGSFRRMQYETENQE